jgi:hypothetical protein
VISQTSLTLSRARKRREDEICSISILGLSFIRRYLKLIVAAENAPYSFVPFSYDIGPSHVFLPYFS